MGYYFEHRQSMFAQAGMNVEHTLDVVVKRYVGNNPPNPVTFRAYSRRGILQVSDFRYHADFNAFFPNARSEQYVYAWARQWSDGSAALMYDLNVLGPLVIWVNGVETFRSNIFTERYTDKKTRLTIPLQAGWNHFVIRYKKTKGGFGGTLGSWLGKHPYTFMMPTAEREGQEGWLFTEPMSQELPALPGARMTEADTKVKWLPQLNWDAKLLKKGQLHRIYGTSKNNYAIGWTCALCMQPGTATYNLKGTSKGPISIFIDGEEVLSSKSAGKINGTFDAAFGFHDLFVQSTCAGDDWGYELSIEQGGEEVRLMNPANCQGTDQAWIYIGPFPKSQSPDFDALRNLTQVHKSIDGDTFWRLDSPDAWVRMYNENALYGRWNYPLGVTLYGLFKSSRVIGSKETEDYIVRHMQSCADTFEYALWDKQHYGGATNVHTLLTSLDSLDDCGSFGSAFLEVGKDHEIRGMRRIADYVADFITNQQDRLEDGTFYRREMMHIFHENTMWADDLYMSTPFLCRYYQLTGDRQYIDDAARQFLGFKKRLYMPELKVMSHVYDLRRDMATGVPWGRGNGWPIFSLSELLAVIPENHELRPQLLQFFRDLCSGYLALQDEQGMWHQVLTHHDSYPETSCTSMFMYAFARGVQYGWLQDPEPYIRSIYKGWEALNKVSIDRGGNIHGVCRGSEFSFTPEYYKKELLPNLNDTHGIGIVLLAGVEVTKLTEFLKQNSLAPKERKATRKAKAMAR
jgi:rhamnogalacturonyl hydrolase YesR